MDTIIDAMWLIAVSMKEKLQDKYPLAVSRIEKRMRSLHESKMEDINLCMHFLLKTACEFNLLKETHDLLELNLFKDINQPLQFEQESTKINGTWGNGNGTTLLGLAAFNGQIEMVSYLVEVKLADVNKKDVNGDTPLHQAVYGDDYPFNCSGHGVAHDKVAKYLIRNGGDLSIKNNNQQTPYDRTKWCAPLKIENVVGRRFITNTGSAVYYADKVRPVLEHALAQQSRDQNIQVVRFGGERQAKNFNQFCLEHAIETYIEDEKASFGYASIEDLYHVLDTLSEKEWEHIRKIVSSQEPAPFSYRMGLIYDELPKMGKQSIAIGILVALFAYYETQNILLSVTTGSLSAVLAWHYLTEAGYKQKMNERLITNQRIETLRQHDRFFKAPSIVPYSSPISQESTRGFSLA